MAQLTGDARKDAVTGSVTGSVTPGSVTGSLVFPVPVGLEHCAQNIEFNTSFLSLLTEGETVTLRESLS